MNQKELTSAVYAIVKKAHPRLNLEITEAVVSTVFDLMVSTTVSGEPVEIQGLFSLRPTVHLRNEKLKYQKAGHAAYLVVRLRMGSIFKRTFAKFKDTFTEIVEWKELDNGKARVQARFKSTGGVIREDGNGEPPVPLVRGGDARAATELPDPWLRALRGETKEG